MKRLLIILFLLACMVSQAQVEQKIATWYQYDYLHAGKYFGLPSDTFAVATAYKNVPFLARIGDTFYYWSVTQYKWLELAQGGGGSAPNASLPIYFDGTNYTIKGLSGIGSNGQIIMSNGTQWNYFTPDWLKADSVKNFTMALNSPLFAKVGQNGSLDTLDIDTATFVRPGILTAWSYNYLINGVKNSTINTRMLNTTGSIVGGHDFTTDFNLHLQGDIASGSRMYYGFDDDGVIGFHYRPEINEAGAVAGSLLTYNVDSSSWVVDNTLRTTISNKADKSGTITINGQTKTLGSNPSFTINTTVTETDPVYSASAASGITTANINNWNQAYNKYATSGTYNAGTITFTSRDGTQAFQVTGLPTGTGSGTVTSVNASISGALGVTGGPITGAGTLAFAWQGTSSQYVLGDGTLATKITNLNQLTNGPGYISNSTLNIANSVGTNQFTLNTGDQFKIEGTGATTVSFDAANKKLTINSTAGTGADGNSYPTAISASNGTIQLTSSNGMPTISGTASGTWPISVSGNSATVSTVTASNIDNVFSSNGLLKRTAAGSYTAITDNSSNWNTAFGWGNHATAGYMTGLSVYFGGTNLIGTRKNLNFLAGNGIGFGGSDDGTNTNVTISLNSNITSNSSNGTTNNIPKYSSTTQFTGSVIWDVSGKVGINQGTPFSSAALTVKGLGTTSSTYSWASQNSANSFTGVLADDGTLQIAGDIVAFYSFSDRRLKRDIHSVDNTSVLDRVMKLRPVTYQWKDKDGLQYGLIAQEVEKVFPEFVDEQRRLNDPTVYKRVDYAHMTSVLIASVQQLQNEINKLKKGGRK